MNEGGAPRPVDPVPIGHVAAPPFVRLPEPGALFGYRSARFRSLAENEPAFGSYLRFLAEVAKAQYEIQDGLPELKPLDPEAFQRARERGMPPLDRSRLTSTAAFATTLDRLLIELDDIIMPSHARAAMIQIKRLDRGPWLEMSQAILSNAIPRGSLAEHVFVAAALQVHFARMAAQLDETSLLPLGKRTCPACGGRAVSTLIVGWSNVEDTRFCACSLCATLWHHVRMQCTRCGSTEGIGYTEMEGRSVSVKAETCDACHGYVKIMHQHTDPALEPVADDVGTLGLDIMMREAGYRRGGVNPYLIGY